MEWTEKHKQLPTHAEPLWKSIEKCLPPSHCLTLFAKLDNDAGDLCRMAAIFQSSQSVVCPIPDHQQNLSIYTHEEKTPLREQMATS